MSTLPQLSSQVFLADSGLETTLIFHDGYELPEFAAFPLLRDDAGRDRLRRYYAAHVDVAAEAGLGIVLEAPTWRASSDWGHQLGYGASDLAAVNRDAVDLLSEVRSGARTPVVVSGCIGPREDAYAPGSGMDASAAQDYHRPQVEAFVAAGADMVHAMTLTSVAEAVGIVRAASASGLPVAISYTVETDGRLPDGTTLEAAVTGLDEETDGMAVYLGINCAHPAHLEAVLAGGPDWTTRLRSLRANASQRSHAELDEAEELDSGDPAELASDYTRLTSAVPTLTVLGGCCGTDLRHIRAIAAAVA